jgi:hypothetical protein
MSSSARDDDGGCFSTATRPRAGLPGGFPPSSRMTAGPMKRSREMKAPLSGTALAQGGGGGGGTSSCSATTCRSPSSGRRGSRWREVHGPAAGPGGNIPEIGPGTQATVYSHCARLTIQKLLDPPRSSEGPRNPAGRALVRPAGCATSQGPPGSGIRSMRAWPAAPTLNAGRVRSGASSWLARTTEGPGSSLDPEATVCAPDSLRRRWRWSPRPQ